MTPDGPFSPRQPWWPSGGSVCRTGDGGERRVEADPGGRGEVEAALAGGLRDADRAVAAGLGGKAHVMTDVPALVAALAAELRAGDRVVVMSNGGFGGLYERLLAALRSRTA